MKKKDSKTDVRPPKRPMTGYAYFMRSEGHNFKGMDIKEVSALLSSKWKAMGEEERRVIDLSYYPVATYIMLQHT